MKRGSREAGERANNEIKGEPRRSQRPEELRGPMEQMRSPAARLASAATD